MAEGEPGMRRPGQAQEPGGGKRPPGGSGVKRSENKVVKRGEVVARKAAIECKEPVP